MVIERRRLKSTKAMTSIERIALFAPPLLLEGEEDAIYDELLASICAAVKPVDGIDEMFVAEVVFLQWEVLRWRRLKSSLMSSWSHEKLKDFLESALDYGDYREEFEETLTATLQEILANARAEDSAQTLARKCAANEQGANDKVNKLLDAAGLQLEKLLDDAKAKKAGELSQAYVRRESNAVKQVNEFFASSGITIDNFTADAVFDHSGDYGCLTIIERIDRLITITESRRNASLREIDRHRTVLGEALRRNVQQIEDGELRVIETKSPKGNSAA